MSHMPENSAIKVTKSIEEQLAGVTNVEQIKQIMKQASLSQNLIKEDWDPAYTIEVEPSAAPRGYTKTVTVNGVKHSLTADNEAGLIAAENKIYRETMAQPAKTETPARNERGQFTAAEPVATDEQKAALSLQFQLGQITASEYIEKSGAVTEYLEKAGVPLDDLRDAVAEKQNARVEQSWREGTDAFLSSPEGRNWPGGEENMRLVGEVIQSQGWIDAEDKQAALEAAARYLRENNLLVTPPEVAARNKEAELTQKITEANNPQDLRDVLRSGSSGFFGR